jgi:hypothetical protein
MKTFLIAGLILVSSTNTFAAVDFFTIGTGRFEHTASPSCREVLQRSWALLNRKNKGVAQSLHPKRARAITGSTRRVLLF